MEEVIDSQINTLGIKDFLNSATRYTKTIFPNLNISELFSKSLSGDISGVLKNTDLKNLFLSEISVTIEIIVNILIIIIIHSIFKTIVENLGNSSASKVVYFVQYLIIVTIIINSFISILNITEECINNIL